MWWAAKLLALQFFFSAATATAAFEDSIGLYANTTLRSSSGRIDELLVLKRQFRCEFPGGPQCSATTCCRPGERCCPLGCCDVSDDCWKNQYADSSSSEELPLINHPSGAVRRLQNNAAAKLVASLVPNVAVDLLLAVANPGLYAASHPSRHAVQQAQHVAEIPAAFPEKLANAMNVSTPVRGIPHPIHPTSLNGSIDALKSGKVARFEYDQKKNGCLLVNMCNGMRGKNTIELTYSGKLSKSAKAAKRRQAGCVSGYCRKLGLPGLNSCDEFPPASSDEGGSTLPTIQRAINCIPGIQNSLQGNIFSQMVQRSKIQAGDSYVISIDCDKVLGAGTSPCDRRSVPRAPMSGIAGVMRRDEIQISNSTTLDSYYPANLTMDTGNIIILPFDDLGPGQYATSIEVIAGSISGSYVVDNLGDAYASSADAATLGQSQQMGFTVEDDGALMGVGMILVTPDANTRIKWSFQGQDLGPSSDGGGDKTSDSDSDTSSGAPRVVAQSWISITVVGVVVLLVRIATY